MSGQLTIMELSAMLTQGAIVSASMQWPAHDMKRNRISRHQVFAQLRNQNGDYIKPNDKEQN